MEINEKVLKKVSINGINVMIEVSKEEYKNFPKKIESKIRIRDTELEPISIGSIFF